MADEWHKSCMVYCGHEVAYVTLCFVFRADGEQVMQQVARSVQLTPKLGNIPQTFTDTAKAGV